MRLTTRHRQIIATRYPDVPLVRVLDRWALVWHEPSEPPATRWWGQLLISVETEVNPDTLVEEPKIWWTAQTQGRTRKAVLEHLRAEGMV